MLPLGSVLRVFAAHDMLTDDLYGLSHLLVIVNEQPWLWCLLLSRRRASRTPR
jgi:hypothetical protein